MIIKPKKSLGQNFLTSGKAIFEIIKGGDIKKSDIVVEIGPGKGVLTEKILLHGAKLIAIEKDKNLIIFLKNKFQKEIEDKQLLLIEEDILNIDFDKFLKNIYKEKINNINYKLIGNIPYYITGAIIEKFLSLDKKPSDIVFLVQKEVADRIVAKNKKESILSLAVKLYGEPKIIYKVSAGSFFPKPKVDSAVISIILNNKNNINKNKEKLYFKIVKSAFSHKRKKMITNLKKDFKDKDLIKIFEKLNLDKNVRAEDLKKDDFLNIVDNL